jgi:hypothetical protein
MAIVPKPAFPNVPLLPGIPQLSRAVDSNTFITGVLGIADGFIWNAISRELPWGIYDQGGSKVLSPDNVMSFDYRNESALSSYPTQEGAFASYNKVHTPFEVSLVMTKGGLLQYRQQFLDSLEAIVDTTQLFNVVTPERTYYNCSIGMQGLSRRAESGSHLVIVEIGLTEIRQVTAQYSKKSDGLTKNSNSASAYPAANGGKVDTQQITSPKTSILKGIFG